MIPALHSSIHPSFQLYAAKGLLSCNNYKMIYTQDLTKSIALNIILGLGTLLAYAAKKIEVARACLIPLAIATVVLTAYHLAIIFYRLVTLKTDRAHRWEPLFNDILKKDYKSALQTLEDLFKLEKIDLIKKPEESLTRLKEMKRRFVVLEPTTFDRGVNQEINIPYLYALLTILSALEQPHSKSDKKAVIQKLDSMGALDPKLIENCKGFANDYPKYANDTKTEPSQPVTLLVNDFIAKMNLHKKNTTFNVAMPLRYLRQIRILNYFSPSYDENVNKFIKNIMGSQDITELLSKIEVHRPKTPMERVLDHLESKTFANKIFDLEEDGINYKIRIICNPEGKTVSFTPAGFGKVSSPDPFIFLCDTNIPESLQEKFKNYKHTTITLKINGDMPLNYSKDPVIS